MTEVEKAIEGREGGGGGREGSVGGGEEIDGGGAEEASHNRSDHCNRLQGGECYPHLNIRSSQHASRPSIDKHRC